MSLFLSEKPSVPVCSGKLSPSALCSSLCSQLTCEQVVPCSSESSLYLAKFLGQQRESGRHLFWQPPTSAFACSVIRGCLVSPVNMAQYCFNLLKCIHKSNQIMVISRHANKFAIPPEARGNRPPVLPSLHITHQPAPNNSHAPYTPIHILHVSPKKFWTIFLHTTKCSSTTIHNTTQLLT